MSEIAREIHSLHMSISLTEFLDLTPCSIWRSIIDENDLVVIIVMNSLKNYLEFMVYIRDIFLFTIGWDDDGDEFLAHRFLWKYTYLRI
jgi:hypothetical protein